MSKFTCVDCKKEFEFSEKERYSYQSKGLIYQPKRCLECRSIKRAKRDGRPTFPFTCSRCKCLSHIDFQPSPGKPLYCADCLRIIKEEQELKEMAKDFARFPKVGTF